jgi:peptidoglycan hydrolase-like protein with peptidoglycan-binding domain
MAVTVQMPVIRRGATGADVSKAQALINVLTGRGLVVDGDFGPATSAAVEDVQRFLKMSPVDGVIGPATWRVLIELP